MVADLLGHLEVLGKLRCSSIESSKRFFNGCSLTLDTLDSMDIIHRCRNFAQLPRQIQMTSLRLQAKNLALYTASSKLFVVVRMMLLDSCSYSLLQKDTQTIAREFGFLFLAALRAPCETTNLCTKYSTEDCELCRCSGGIVA